jgi:phosphoglycerol transferase MdoB-like AlkP superfamily enzyme
MFNSNNIWVTYSAVLIGMIFIILTAIFIKKLFNSNTKDLLVRFILIVFASLVSVFIVDKVIAFGLPLLSIQQNENLFDLIKTLTLMIFSYYFGTQKTTKENDN